MSYKIVNLRTGEYLFGGNTFADKESAENAIQTYLAKQWHEYKDIMMKRETTPMNMFNTFENYQSGIMYYMGKEFRPPEDKEYHFEIIEV